VQKTYDNHFRDSGKSLEGAILTPLASGMLEAELNRNLLTLLDTINDGVYVFDTEWRYTYLNNAAGELIERPREEVLGKNVWELFPEAIDTPFDRESHRAVHEQLPTSFEAFYPSLNKWTECRIYPAPQGITVIAQDITKRKCAELELQFQVAILSTIRHSVIATNLQRHIIYWNEGATRLFGYSAEEMFGKTAAILYTDINEYLHAQEPLQVAEGKDHQGEWLGRRKDGTCVWVDYKSTLFRDNEGNVIGNIGVATDITGRKRVEDELAKRTQEFQTLANHIPDAISRHDRNSSYLYVNPAIESMTGIPPAAFLGKTFREVGLSEQSSTFVDRYLTQVFRTGEPVIAEFSTALANRRVRHFQTSWVPERDAQGTITSVLSITRDVTVSKEQEERKDAFIGMASHELRTPLTVLVGWTELLKQQIEQQGMKVPVVILEKMEVQLDLLTRLVNDLLDVSKILAGRVDYAEEPIVLDELVKEMVETLQTISPQQVIGLSGASQATVIGDRDRLGQVFINLITNAIKYSPRADRVDVVLAKVDESAIIQIRDYGIGIPITHLEHIFERFYRVHDGKGTTFPGLGMGLYICVEIVKRHRGKITVESQEGRGSTFTVFLPNATDVVL